MRWVAGLTWMAGGLAAGAFAANDAPARSEEWARAVRAEMERRQIPGLAATVVREGQIVWTACYGKADLENDVSVTEQTVFRFASVSKAITAVAALRLVEAGRLTVDTPVSERVIASAAAPGGPITVRHLLAHQSGLRHYQPWASREPLTHYNRLADVVRAKADDALLFTPGAKFGYTTHGYVVLGRMIEIAAEREFGEHLRTEIFAAAGMKTARVDDLYALIPHRAQGYFRSLNGELRNSEPADLSDKIPGGGLCGTIGDLGAFVAALQRHALLSQTMTEQMWTPQTLADGSVTTYGFGWYVGAHGGRREVYHPGSQARVSSIVWLSPDDGVAVAIVGNLEQVAWLGLARRLGEIARVEARRE